MVNRIKTKHARKKRNTIYTTQSYRPLSLLLGKNCFLDSCVKYIVCSIELHPIKWQIEIANNDIHCRTIIIIINNEGSKI